MLKWNIQAQSVKREKKNADGVFILLHPELSLEHQTTSPFDLDVAIEDAQIHEQVIWDCIWWMLQQSSMSRPWYSLEVHPPPMIRLLKSQHFLQYSPPDVQKRSMSSSVYIFKKIDQAESDKLHISTNKLLTIYNRIMLNSLIHTLSLWSPPTIRTHKMWSSSLRSSNLSVLVVAGSPDLTSTSLTLPISRLPFTTHLLTNGLYFCGSSNLLTNHHTWFHTTLY